MSISTADIFLHCAPLQLALDARPIGSTRLVFLTFYVRIIYGGLGVVSKNPEGAHWLALILGALYTLIVSILFSDLDGLFGLGWVVALIATCAASPEVLPVMQPLAFSMVLLVGLAGVPRAYLTNDARSMGPVLLNLACVVRAILDESEKNHNPAVHVNLALASLTLAIRCLVPLVDSDDRRTQNHRYRRHRQEHGYHDHQRDTLSSLADSDGSMRSCSRGSAGSRGRSSTRRKIICVSDRAHAVDSGVEIDEQATPVQKASRLKRFVVER